MLLYIWRKKFGNDTLTYIYFAPKKHFNPYNYKKINQTTNYAILHSVLPRRITVLLFIMEYRFLSLCLSLSLMILPCHPVRMANKAFLGRFIYGPHYANGLYVTQRDRCNV